MIKNMIVMGVYIYIYVFLDMYSELSIFMGIWTVEYGLMWKTHCHKQLPNLGMVYGIRFTNGLTALMRMYNDYNTL